MDRIPKWSDLEDEDKERGKDDVEFMISEE